MTNRCLAASSALLFLASLRADEASWGRAILEAERLQREGSYARAEALLSQALPEAERFGPEDPRLAKTLNNLASIRQDLGRFVEAEKLYRRSVGILEKTPSGEHGDLVHVVSNLTTLYLETGQPAKAGRLFRRLADLSRVVVLGDASAGPSYWLLGLADIEHYLGKYEEAESLYRQALAVYEKSFAPEAPELVRARNNLALLLARSRRYDEALALFSTALRALERGGNAPAGGLSKVLNNLATVYTSMGLPAEAEPFFQESLVLAETALSPGHPTTGTVLSNYALMLRRVRRKAEAKALERRAAAVHRSAPAESPARHTIDLGDLLERRLASRRRAPTP